MRRDGAANRERIVAAAEQVFGAGGTAASTEEVARAAGVGIATVFRHFPTKQELLEAAAERYLRRIETGVRDAGEDPDPGRALAAALRVLVASGPTKVTLLNLLLTDAGGLTTEVVTTVDAVRGVVAQVLRRAQDAGAARTDAAVGDVLVLARALAHVAAPDDTGSTERATGIVLDGLAAHGAEQGRGATAPREAPPGRCVERDPTDTSSMQDSL